MTEEINQQQAAGAPSQPAGEPKVSPAPAASLASMGGGVEIPNITSAVESVSVVGAPASIPVAASAAEGGNQIQPLAATVVEPIAASGTEGAARFNVLLVEDDTFLNLLLKAKLEKGGVGVTLAIDGESAIKMLEEGTKPDLVLLDLILPGKSGFEVMSYIQGNPQVSSVPVIILSNLSQDSDVSKVKEMGAVEYYVKAKTSIDDLVARVEEFLNKAKS